MKKMMTGKRGRQSQWEFASPTPIEKRERHDPLLPLLLTPHTTFPHGCTRDRQQQWPAESFAQEIKGTEGMCWQGLVPLSSQGCKWLSCSHRFKEHFHFTAKVHLMRNRFSGFGLSSESPGGEGRPPRSWMWMSALWGLSRPLSLEPQSCLGSRGKGVERWEWRQKSESTEVVERGLGEKGF